MWRCSTIFLLGWGVVSVPAMAAGAQGDPASVEVRGADRLVLSRIVASTPTDIAGLTIDEWETVCAPPCAFAARSTEETYGVGRHGHEPVRADGPPLRLERGVLEISHVDRAGLRTAGAVIAILVPLVGLFVTLLPTFVWVDGLSIGTTIAGSATVILGTALGLGLAFHNDTARITLTL